MQVLYRVDVLKYRKLNKSSLVSGHIEMSIQDLVEVCRLCLKNDNLVSVKDKITDTGKDLKELIRITSGVEVSNFIISI